MTDNNPFERKLLIGETPDGGRLLNNGLSTGPTDMTDYAESLIDKSTDELLTMLPDNLYVARNDSAPKHDRWRIYNIATAQHTAPGYSTVRELLIGTLTRIENNRRKLAE